MRTPASHPPNETPRSPTDGQPSSRSQPVSARIFCGKQRAYQASIAFGRAALQVEAGMFLGSCNAISQTSYSTTLPGPGPPSRGGKVAEGVGFEPTVGFPTAVFKTAAINRSTTPPEF